MRTVRVGLEQVAHRAVVGDFLFSINGPYLSARVLGQVSSPHNSEEYDSLPELETVYDSSSAGSRAISSDDDDFETDFDASSAAG